MVMAAGGGCWRLSAMNFSIKHNQTLLLYHCAVCTATAVPRVLLLVLRSCCHPPSSSCFILRGWKHTFLQIGMNNSILVQYQVVQMHAIVTFIQVLICLWYNIVHWNFQNPIPNSNWNGRWGEDKVRELSQQSKVKKLPDKSCNTKAWTRGLSLLILPVQK